MARSSMAEQNGGYSRPLSRREEEISVRVWIPAASRAEDEEKQEQMTIAIAGMFNGGNAVCVK
jgi:hypothetical protein